MEILLKDNPALVKAHREYTRFTADEKSRELYEQRRKTQRDMNSRLDTARRQGEEKGKIETAVRLLAMGLSSSQIAQATGLSVDDIEKL